MIVVENLTKQFGDHVLLENASFQINGRERVGLVGRNGHGKTTLFRILIGQESYDDGCVALPKQYRVGYVTQQIAFSADTVLGEGIKGLPQHEQDHYWKVEKVLSGLGFSEKDLQCHPDTFSAGYQERLNLAKVLVSDPDILLLDEPTNYLDITSIRWMEEFLRNWPRELLLITHDRSFMDKVVTHTMGIHRRKIRKISGNTEKYYDQLAQDEEIYEKTRLKDERRRKEIEQFITRFRAKARLANLVQSRIKTLSKMQHRERLEAVRTLDFSFRSLSFEGRQVLNVKDLSFSYLPDQQLISALSFTLRAKERLCVVGKNGKGKTTLLKLLSGSLTPETGHIRYNPNVVSGIFEQSNAARLIDSKTVEEEILSAHHDVSRQLARNICGAMMFEGDDALKKIGILSGGEKSRVMLGKILATPVNLLLLDEPTNHLDMASCDALLAAIDGFDGAVIMVTHNEMLLHALAERLVVFQHNRIGVFEGSYQRFLETVGWEDEKPPAGGKVSNDNGFKEKLSKKEMRRLRSEVVTERSKTLKPLEKRIHAIELEIEANEKKLEALDAAMVSASEAQNGERIVEISQAIHACRKAIDQLFNELEIATRELDEKKIEFDERLKRMDLDQIK